MRVAALLPIDAPTGSPPAKTETYAGIMNDMAPPAQLGQMITGYWTSQAIYTAAKFGIADLLADGPKSADELAKATETKTDLLYRLLRALASVGVFAEDEQNRFSLTPLAEPLRTDVPGSQRSLALMMGEDQYRAWGNLADTVQTGDNAYEKIFGKPIFEHLAEQPEKARIFDDAMTGIHGRETGAILDAYDFAGINVIADIGGGNGSKITAILQKHRNMRGVLFDLPHVVEPGSSEYRIRCSDGPLPIGRRGLLPFRPPQARTPTSCDTSSMTGTTRSRSRS